jgi:hypothetical protein
MVEAYTSERRFIESQGASLGTAAVTLKDVASQESEETDETLG